ncbi:MAG: SpoIID/LytB domain-containing protein [Tissierellia bacterium]|nr:SpoIID/LytB domain-containing protein [Tissierellia bacterium]
MKKIIKIILFSMLITILSINVSFGEDVEEFVRVRIRTPRRFNEQAELNGYGLITVYDLSSGKLVELLQLDNELSVLMDSYFDKTYNYLENNNLNNALIGPIHVRIKDNKFSTYDEVKSKINNIEQKIGSGFYPYYNGSNYHIYYGAFTNETSANNILNKLNEIGLTGEIVNSNRKNVVVYNGNNEIVFLYSNNSNIYFSSKNSKLLCNMIKIDGKAYRGDMSFNIINDSTLISINRVDIESYLYGVVPSESPASWPIDALKAQTLTARTYAIKNLKPFSNYGYDLQDNTYDQVYGGYDSEYESTNRAVDETKGEKIYYDGKLIDAVFHSTSGGSTEDSENVWANALPYLRGVIDEYSNISPVTQWKETYTKEDIIKRLNLYDNDVRELYSIEITRFSENNRVQECIFHTDKGKITYTKDTVRSVLGLRSLWFTIAGSGTNGNNGFYFIDSIGNGIDVPSRGSIIDSILDDESQKEEELKSNNLNGLYVISDSKTSKITTTDNLYFISSSETSKVKTGSENSDGSNYVIQGRGWGHGVGMSQYGAKQMATEGFTYDEIIKHYYTGVNIK